MPYNLKEKEIRTKLFGVRLKLDNDFGRQQLLQIMRDNPKAIEKIYVFGTHCYVKYNAKDYVLGRIREEYSSLLNSHDTEVQHWEITGGYEIEKKNGNSEMANLGINIIIKLSKIEIPVKEVPKKKEDIISKILNSENDGYDGKNESAGKRIFAI